ncbi:MAG: hypothetical protein M0009_13290 [Deltaproteobacteria bacterium]|nr:hypothetical protein [Deltaproteobacteria bacterium]
MHSDDGPESNAGGRTAKHKERGSVKAGEGWKAKAQVMGEDTAKAEEDQEKNEGSAGLSADR